MAAKSKVAYTFPLAYIHWRIQQWGHSPTTPQLQNDNNDNGPMGCVQEIESRRELLFEKSRVCFDMWLCIRMYDETQNTYSSDVHVKFGKILVATSQFLFSFSHHILSNMTAFTDTSNSKIYHVSDWYTSGGYREHGGKDPHSGKKNIISALSVYWPSLHIGYSSYITVLHILT
jgi:hypothetical protein